jgi:formylglycine-generating enzyme required for sulfatase activity
LDKYFVTVGRFRKFVAAYNGGSGWTPSAGSGKHSHLNGGKGLVDVGAAAGTVAYEAGWASSYNANLSLSSASLMCAGNASWTASAGANETLPINCINWYDAYAFCIWDGGFLPSEAEWEYAAAGGSQQREYPWGSTDPGTANQYAIYSCYNGCYTAMGPLGLGTVGTLAPVGSTTLGGGLWGHFDLAGELREWTMDLSAQYVSPCTDCADLTSGANGELRGGDYLNGTASNSPNSILPTSRNGSYGRSAFLETFGFRCARAP